MLRKLASCYDVKCNTIIQAPENVLDVMPEEKLTSQVEATLLVP
jgi:hypothetical protein